MALPLNNWGGKGKFRTHIWIIMFIVKIYPLMSVHWWDWKWSKMGKPWYFLIPGVCGSKVKWLHYMPGTAVIKSFLPTALPDIGFQPWLKVHIVFDNLFEEPYSGSKHFKMSSSFMHVPSDLKPHDGPRVTMTQLSWSRISDPSETRQKCLIILDHSFPR